MKEDDDDFFDARGDEQTLQDMQAEMQKFDETQIMGTCRGGDISAIIESSRDSSSRDLEPSSH